MHRSTSYQPTRTNLPPLKTSESLGSQQQWTRNWIESILKQPLPITNLFLCLRTGVILCRLINILHPGTVSKIHYNECVSAKEENIQQFLDGASKAGLQDFELFHVNDLLEGKDMNAVMWTISRLAILTETQQQISWSSYDLCAIGSSKLASPLSPLVNDNNTINNFKHAIQHELLNVGNNIPAEKGLDDHKEVSSYHSSDQPLSLSIHQRRDQDSQGIKEYNLQHRHSLWSLPDEEDDIDWDHHHRPHSPRTRSFGSSSPTQSQNTSKSIKTYSIDSGYGTTRQPTPHSTSLELASLFDQKQQQYRPITPSSTFQESKNESGTDDDEDDNNGADPSNTFTLPIGLSTPPPSNDIHKNGKGSISSRLSGLSFGKKFSLRQKTPFHMRYQEWTESHLNSTSQTRPSVIHMFNPSDQKPCVHPSVSSPLLTQQQPIEASHHQSNEMMQYITHESTAEQPINNPSPLNEPVRRRKSTGNLGAQKRSTITRTSSEIECQEDNLELIDGDGQVVARYKLGNVIGKGQFGIVYRALELRTGRMVAVKRIKLDSSKKGDLLDVMQEAQILKQLSHPNIVKYEGIIQTEDHVNIILEYVENGSLLNTLKSFGSFPEHLVASYCTRVLYGLRYLHDQNVAHCDLKSANLLTTKSGHVKLSDFGVSLNLGLKETEVGAVAGTPNWMAPEVIELNGASTKSDIWSLGCTIIELCTGKPPYSDLLPMTALFRIVEDDFPPLPNGLSQDLCNFLKSCFAKNPDDRPTAEDLLSHPWIRSYQHEETQIDQLDVVKEEGDDIRGSLNRPTNPLPASDIDLPSWYVPDTNHPASSSLLADKFQQQQEEHHNYFQQHYPIQIIPHCYVKGTFPKGAVKCKSCHLPIKKDAFICEECGIICHDQCKKTSVCHGSTYIAPPTIRRQSSLTPPYTQDITDPVLVNPPRSLSYQRRSDSAYSLQAFLSSASQHEEPLKPRNSVSTQLRQGTRKLSRVFSSRHPPSSSSSSSSTPPPAPQQSHRSLTHGSKSYDTLRQIQEESYYSKPVIQPSSYPLEYDSPLSTCSSSSSSSIPHRRESEPGDRHKRSIRRNKIKRRGTNPDDCIIS